MGSLFPPSYDEPAGLFRDVAPPRPRGLPSSSFCSDPRRTVLFARSSRRSDGRGLVVTTAPLSLIGAPPYFSEKRGISSSFDPCPFIRPGTTSWSFCCSVQPPHLLPDAVRIPFKEFLNSGLSLILDPLSRSPPPPPQENVASARGHLAFPGPLKVLSLLFFTNVPCCPLPVGDPLKAKNIF